MQTNNQQFTKKQLEAINCELKKTLVIAPAGSGKTLVLIERIKHYILHHKIPKERILVITFTRKAIAEINERIRKNIFNTYLPWARTFGSLLYRIIIRARGVEKMDDVFQTWDESSLVWLILKKEFKFETALWCDVDNLKEYWKKERKNIDTRQEKDYLLYQSEIKLDSLQLEKLFNDCDEYKNKKNFELKDLFASSALEVLQNPKFANYWRNQFDAILIDEFQDVNTQEIEIIYKLLGSHNNIFCVGDPNQSIYKFRDSSPEIFEEFKIRNSDVQEIYLNENFRSSPEIIKFCKHIVDLDLYSEHKQPEVQTKNVSGKKIKILSTCSEVTEAEWVAEEIERLLKTDKYKLSDFAVLCRWKSEDYYIYLENEFTKKNILFFRDKTIKNIREELLIFCAYVRLAFEDDEETIKKVLNVPNRKLGDTTIKKLVNYSKVNNKSLFHVLETIDNTENLVNKPKKTSINCFVNVINMLRSYDKKTECKTLFQKIWEITEYEDYLIKSNKEVAMETLKRILSHVPDNDHPQKALSYLLEVEINEKNNNFVSISTIHKAKGKEFKCVFLLRANLEDKSEKYRLLYVAASRAKEHLFLSYTKPSSFMEDISDCCVVEKIEKNEDF